MGLEHSLCKGQNMGLHFSRALRLYLLFISPRYKQAAHLNAVQGGTGGVGVLGERRGVRQLCLGEGGDSPPLGGCSFLRVHSIPL